jgi:hypothetical protein
MHTMASCDDAASLLILELGLAWVLPLDLGNNLLCLPARNFAAALFRRQKRRPVYGGDTGRSQVRGFVFRIALLLLGVVLGFYLALL